MLPAVQGQKPSVSSDLLPQELVVKHRTLWPAQANTAVRTPADLKTFLKKQLGYADDIDLQLIHQRTGQTLDHYHYQITFKGLRILGGEIHAAVLPDGAPKLVQAPVNQFIGISGKAPRPEDALTAKGLLGAEEIVRSEVILLPDGEGNWNPATYVELAGPETLHREVVLLDNEIVFNNDLHKYHHRGGPNDTTVNVRVFDPDPLTTAQETYGGNYRDKNDQNSGQLNSQRKQRATTFSFRNGLFVPENDYVKITEFSAPITAQTAQNSPDFNFTRDKDQFEDVNVVYHITHLREHIKALGYPNLPSYQVQVDAHALSGSDQSFFSTSVFPYRLYFGEGGVDDAEDADVILHEFAHAVIYEAAPTGSKATERKCIEEALCDYFAASYSWDVSTFGGNDVFNWDGHNEFWPGRSVSTNKDYGQASFKNGNFYTHTDIMASAVTMLSRRLGRDAADQLVLEACYFLTSSTTMPEFGRYLLISDSLLNGAANIRAISESFVQRGILNQVISTDEYQRMQADIEIMATNRFTNGGQLIIRSTEGLEEILLYDLNGREVAHIQVPGAAEVLLSGEDFQTGLYLILVKNRQGSVLRQKLLRH